MIQDTVAIFWRETNCRQYAKQCVKYQKLLFSSRIYSNIASGNQVILMTIFLAVWDGSTVCLNINISKYSWQGHQYLGWKFSQNEDVIICHLCDIICFALCKEEMIVKWFRSTLAEVLVLWDESTLDTDHTKISLTSLIHVSDVAK